MIIVVPLTMVGKTLTEAEADASKVSMITQALETPFLLTLTGSSLISLGVFLLTLSAYFLPRNEKDNLWLSFWGMFVVCIGGCLYTVSTFVNSPILISIGGVFLTIGLVLFACYLMWQLHDVSEDLNVDDPKKYQDNIEERAVLGIVSMLVTLIGVSFFFIKAVQRMVKPYFGPANYNLFGSLAFGSGAFTYFLLNISFTETSDVRKLNAFNFIFSYFLPGCNLHFFIQDDYDPLPNSDKYGAFLFTLGSLLLMLASSRSFYIMDLQVVNNFPAIISLEMKPRQSLLFIFASSLLFLFSFLLITAELLTSGDDRIKFVGSCTVFIFISYTIFTFSWNQKSRTSGSAVFGHVANAIALLMYSVGTLILLRLQKGDDPGRYHYGNDLRTASMAIAFLSGMMLTVLAYPQTVYQFFSPGNYYMAGTLLFTLGSLCLFLSSLTTSEGKDDYDDTCDIACHGTRELGYTFWCLSALFYFLFSVILNDVVSVEYESSMLIVLKSVLQPLLPSAFAADLKGKGDFSPVSTDTEKTDKLESAEDRETREEAEREQAVAISLDLMEEINAAGDSVNFLDTDVFVVGCGPTGLTLANELGLRNVRTVAIDMRSDVSPDSRFFNLSPPTVEGLKRIGVLPKILERSLSEDFGHGSISATGLQHSDLSIIAAAYGPSRAVAKKLGKQLSISLCAGMYH